MRSVQRVRCLLAAVVATLTVGACASTIEGTGTADVGARGTDSATPTESTESTESTEPTETTESTQPTEQTDDDGELTCEGEGVVAPAGQPFCFTLPMGFTQDEIDVDNSAGSSASYTTGAVLNQRDVVVFSVYDLNIDSDDLSDQAVADALAPIITQLGEQGFEFESTEPVLEEVDGARAFFYQGSDATGLFSETYFIFRGFTELQVNCQWAAEREALLAGCEEILGSLQVTG